MGKKANEPLSFLLAPALSEAKGAKVETGRVQKRLPLVGGLSPCNLL